MRVPWTARRSNQSILKEISPEYSLEGLMLKLKLQYFGHPVQRTDSFEKTLMLGKIDIKMQDIKLYIYYYLNFSLQMVTAAMKLKDTCSLEGKL